MEMHDQRLTDELESVRNKRVRYNLAKPRKENFCQYLENFNEIRYVNGHRNIFQLIDVKKK